MCVCACVCVCHCVGGLCSPFMHMARGGFFGGGGVWEEGI